MLGMLVVISLTAAPCLGAPTVFTVDSSAQRGAAGDLPENCTLGDAIVAANQDAPEDGCSDAIVGTGGPFEIVLPAGERFVLEFADGAGTDGDVGLPVVSSNVAIRGNGSTIERESDLACPAGSPSDFRILEVAEEGQLELEDVAIRNGCAPSAGGIRNAGNLILRSVTLSENTAHDGPGGGLGNVRGDAEILRSNISGNVTPQLGGGIYSFGSVDLVIDRSTVARNRANVAGGLSNAIGRTFLINSTVSGNFAMTRAGGIENSGGGQLALMSSTIAGNQAPGIVNRIGRMTFASSILEDRCLFIRDPGNTDAGYNLERRNTCGLRDPSSMPDTPAVLGPLRDNGGPTETHALLAGSPAVDAADDGVCTGPDTQGLDQRGVGRPDGEPFGIGRCDIGAVELVDCDANGVDDGTEIADDPVRDRDGNTVLDACEDSPPSADAGPDQTLECGSFEGAEVALDGTGSSEPDGGALAFTWSGTFGVLEGEAPTLTLPLGSEWIVLEVEDEGGNVASDVVVVTVRDTIPPMVEASLQRVDGWGSWHRLRVHAACADVCDPEASLTASVDGLPVVDGEVLTYKGFGRHVAAPELLVHCEDAAGNAVEVTAEPPPRPGRTPHLEHWKQLLRERLEKLREWIREAHEQLRARRDAAMQSPRWHWRSRFTP
jgi:hypothetical protein